MFTMTFPFRLGAAFTLMAGLALVSCHCEEAKENETYRTAMVPLVPSRKLQSLPPPEEPPPLFEDEGDEASEPEVVKEPQEVFVLPVETLRVSHAPCAEAGGEVVIRFSLPMVEIGELKDAGHPQVVFKPEQKGIFRWRSPTELVFRPDREFLGWGQDVEVSIDEATPLAGKEFALERQWRASFTVPFLRIAGKVASWPIVKDHPRFMGFLNHFSMKVGRGPLFLLYDQPVKPWKVKKLLRVTDSSDQILKTRVWRPSSAKQVFDGEIDTDYLVAVRIVDPPEDEEIVTFETPDWEVPKDPTFHEHELTVSTDFSLSNAYQTNPRDDERVRLEAGWILTFSNPFQVSVLKESLRITPRPRSVEVSRSGWQRARVRLELEPGVRYRMTTTGRFKDVLGNRLKERVNIRFKSQDLPPLLSVPVEPVLLESNGSRLPVRVLNTRSLRARVLRFRSTQAFARALSTGKASNCREYGLSGKGRRLKAFVGKLRMNTTKKIELELSVKAGLLCVEVSGHGRGSDAAGLMNDAVLVHSTDLGITAKVFEKTVFAWVTRLSDASPVEGARISLLDERGKRIGRGTTDKIGTIVMKADKFATGTGISKPLVLVAEEGDDVAVFRMVDDHLSHPWQFGLKGKVQGTGVMHAAVFTERGVYRPGEVVHLKVIVGGEAGRGNDKVNVQIKDPRGQRVAKKALQLDRFRSADLDVKLKEQAAVGEYLVQVKVGQRLAVRRFRVEEYRVPTFRVSVKSAEAWKRGADIKTSIRAEYLRGGSLDGREARWEVLRKPEAFTPAAFPRYVFRLGDPAGLAGGIAAGRKRLDGRGQLLVGFRADHPSSAGPMRYILEAAVTDVDRQTYAGRLTRVIHPAAFYVGVLPPPRQVMAAGEKLRVPIVTVKPNGTPIDGVRVRARLERIDHHTVVRMTKGAGTQMLSRPVPVEQKQCEITTRKTAVNCVFSFPGAGLYRVRAWARDLEQQSVQTGFEIAASGDNPSAWPRFDQDRIEVIADKPGYQAGDIARLVVQTPFKKARGLLTIERDGVFERRVFRIDGDTPMIEVPITADYAPNVYVSIILLRGRTHLEKDDSGFETGAPSFKIGYANIKVEPGDRRLAVKVTPARREANPGQTMKIHLSVKDQKGAPRSGQATVMVVDEAVLGLTGYRTPDPIAQIFAERPLGVRTGSIRLELPHAKRSRLEKIFPGGDGGGGFDLAEFPMELRKLFKSTAYWNPDIQVGKDGKASIEFELPDNTTTYRVMAVVSDGDNRVGSSKERVVVRKPLMVQPVLPRFVYPEDELQVEALVFNGTGTEGEVRLSGRFNGLQLVEGSADRRAKVKAGSSGSYKFSVKVASAMPEAGEVSVRFAAKLGDHADAVEVKLPVLGPGTRRTVVAGKSILDADDVSLTLPADRIPGSALMEVVTSTTVLSELKDSVQYLMRYPNGCIEQTTSTAYPLVVLKDLLPEIGVDVDRGDLKKFSEAGIRRILSFQTPSGGLSYWPGSPQPHAFATAFGLTALIEAKKRGYEVPDEALEGMANYLEASLRRGRISSEMPHGSMADGDTRALFVMTLGRLGRPQPGYISALWRNRKELTAFGLSFLAIAVREMPGDQSLLQPILQEIRNASVEEEKEVYFAGRSRGGWSMGSPLRTHGSALVAFASTGGSGEMSAKLLNGLLKRRQYGLWGNTQENVFGIMGIHAVAKRKVGGGRPKMELLVQGKKIAESEMEKVSSRVRRLTIRGSDMALADGKEEIRTVSLKNNGGAPIFLTVRAQYEVQLIEENRKARSKGFTITRRYETMDGESLEGKPIPLGSLVRVRLYIRTKADHNYVAIDDRLPAGLEPLNASLETTELFSRGKFSTITQRSLSVLSYSEIRDSRVAFYVDEMLPGEYEYTYVGRATTPGKFLRPAARAEAMYQPEISGTTSIDYVEVK